MSYPEVDLRRQALQAVHARVAGSDTPFFEVWYEDVPSLVGDPANLPSQAQQRFWQLVQEGYIRAEELGASRFGSATWVARVTGLTDKGLREIGVLPPEDAYTALVAGLERRIAEIEEDPAIPPEEKQRQVSWWRSALGSLGDLAKEVGPSVVGEVVKRSLGL